VIADVDGILRHDGSRTLAGARPMLQRLAGSTLVLCSSRASAEVLALQRDLGIRQPFISEGGARLHIPHGYFCGTAGPGDGFETIDFGARRFGHAVRLLIALFRTGAETPLIVGVGVEWRDRVLLRAVDVPIVVRESGVDQTTLLRNLPNAYVTDNECLPEALFGRNPAGQASPVGHA
jgi:predicted mannosyl-3-phosphoglycerate phosphatase (HAD superfamily)